MSEVDHQRPAPVPDEASQPYFDGAREGWLMLQHCESCGATVAPLKARCDRCFSANITWVAASGRGTLYSFAIVHQLYHPAFAGKVPYNVAMVDLEEGVRMTANVVSCPNEDLRIGMPLEVAFEEAGGDISLPMFAPSYNGQSDGGGMAR